MRKLKLSKRHRSKTLSAKMGTGLVTVFLSTYLILLSCLGTTTGFIIAHSVHNSNSIYVREIMEK